MPNGESSHCMEAFVKEKDDEKNPSTESGKEKWIKEELNMNGVGKRWAWLSLSEYHMDSMGWRWRSMREHGVGPSALQRDSKILMGFPFCCLTWSSHCCKGGMHYNSWTETLWICDKIHQEQGVGCYTKVSRLGNNVPRHLLSLPSSFPSTLPCQIEICRPVEVSLWS